MKETRYINRELSWLGFNHRVLQESKDPTVPLYEKIKFMAIFSSNLDEFFRVRVASLRNLLLLKQKSKKKLKFDPVDLLNQIHKTVNKQQEELGFIYRNIILKELKRNKIYLLNETEMSDSQREYLKSYFMEEVYPFIQPVMLLKNKVTVFLKNNILYLALRLYTKMKTQSPGKPKAFKPRYAVIEIPSWYLPRFLLLPENKGKHTIVFLDDVIRVCLPDIFHGYKIAESYAIKLTRDAEIYIEDEFSGDLIDKIKKGIAKRKTGVPSRFLYDARMPDNFLAFLRSAFCLKREDLVPGGRYHNFSDFFRFPNPGGKNLTTANPAQLTDNIISRNESLFQTIKKKDRMLHFPYHSYEPVIRFIANAARDKHTRSIYITLYRVASNSRIVKELIQAAHNGKMVTVFVEVKARFDEESNIRWAKEMELAGVRVLYSFPALKVHAKCCLVERMEKDKRVFYAYLSTGNFNEKTAEVYTDLGLFTADERLTAEILRIFAFLENQKTNKDYKQLLVAPFNLRSGLYHLIDEEKNNAHLGKSAYIQLKLNNLEDKDIIEKLYEASAAGVQIKILVRGICCIQPGRRKISENIEVFSIVDRFLEHSRIFIFGNGGTPQYWVSSADWMERNLDRRIEIAFPVHEKDLQNELRQILEMQFSDSRKLRVIDRRLTNHYTGSFDKNVPTAQEKIYLYYKSKLVTPTS